MKLTYSGKFKSKLSFYKHKKPKIYGLATISINRFQKNPKDTRLKVHPLKRKMQGMYAFSVTSDIRIIFEFTSKNTVRFLAIGPHHHVY